MTEAAGPLPGPVPDPYPVTPVAGPLDATVRPPGSKSITNRALVCAALAPTPSRLTGALEADDTQAMRGALAALGPLVPAAGSGAGTGAGSAPGASAGGVTVVDARQSGTTARFVLPLLALRREPTRLDGAPQLRARPMADGIAALRALGAEVVEEGDPGHLPVLVRGPEAPTPGVTLDVAGDASSQFLSGLLMLGPVWPGGLRLRTSGGLVSRPYVDMTVAVMTAFGATVHADESGWTVDAGGYRGTDYTVEPDASAASYFFAAAAIVGGRVTVEGLGRASLQGDLAFVDVLARMGCRVERGSGATTVERTGDLVGVDVDMGDLSDTAPTLAAVAVFADSPTRVRGIGFIRHKETDRVGNVVRELRRCGIRAEEEPDGFVVHPGTPQPATVATYDDHRMAMSFALLGLRAEGIRIAGPSCVAKTFPSFWTALDRLR
ncbi:MAG TPA: 3-phosphoshikimate 1-carboxyvinyltransferase [Acidimicrobiales bacterium]